MRSPVSHALALVLIATIAGGGVAAAAKNPSPAPPQPVTGPAADYPVVVGPPFDIDGKTYTPEDRLNYDAVGLADVGSEGGDTVTAAHKTLPLPSYAEVTSLESGKTILVRVVRRGPMSNDHLVELSPGAAAQLGLAGSVRPPVRVRRVNPPEQERAMLRTGGRAPERMATPQGLLDALNRKLAAAVPGAMKPAATPEPAPAATPVPTQAAKPARAPRPTAPAKPQRTLTAVEAAGLPPELPPTPVETPKPITTPTPALNPVETPKPVDAQTPVETPSPVATKPAETPAALSPAPVETPKPVETPAPIATPAPVPAPAPVAPPAEAPAPVPAPAPIETPKAAPAPAASPVSTKPTRAAAPGAASGRPSIVQVATFSNQPAADGVAARLGGTARASGRFWTVKMGPFATRADAQAALAKAKGAGYRDAIILRAN